MFSVAKFLLLFLDVVLPGASGSGSLASCILCFTEKMTIFSNFANPYGKYNLESSFSILQYHTTPQNNRIGVLFLSKYNICKLVH
jgi:hypothetical protein